MLLELKNSVVLSKMEKGITSRSLYNDSNSTTCKFINILTVQLRIFENSFFFFGFYGQKMQCGRRPPMWPPIFAISKSVELICRIECHPRNVYNMKFKYLTTCGFLRKISRFEVQNYLITHKLRFSKNARN